jgi:hypothetical protein
MKTRMNIKRKSISMLLIVALIVTMAVPAFAGESRFAGNDLKIASNEVSIYKQVHDNYGRVLEEVAVIDDILFHFIMTDEHIFVAEVKANGTYNFAFRYVDDQDTIFTGMNMIEDVMAQNLNTRINLPDITPNDNVISVLLENDVIEILTVLYYAIVSDVFSFVTETITVESVYVNEEVIAFDEIDLLKLEGFAVQASGTPHSTMNALLAAHFRPFSNFYLGTTSEVRNGVRASATVRESMTTRHERGISTNFLAGATLLVISAWAGAPVAIISVILLSASGVLLVTSNIVIHWAVEHFTRAVHVNGTVLVNAVRTVDHHVVSGPLGFILNTTRAPSVVNWHRNFGNVPALQREGIDEFFRRL